MEKLQLKYLLEKPFGKNKSARYGTHPPEIMSLLPMPTRGYKALMISLALYLLVAPLSTFNTIALLGLVHGRLPLVQLGISIPMIIFAIIAGRDIGKHCLANANCNRTRRWLWTYPSPSGERGSAIKSIIRIIRKLVIPSPPSALSHPPHPSIFVNNRFPEGDSAREGRPCACPLG